MFLRGWVKEVLKPSTSLLSAIQKPGGAMVSSSLSSPRKRSIELFYEGATVKIDHYFRP